MKYSVSAVKLFVVVCSVMYGSHVQAMDYVAYGIKGVNHFNRTIEQIARPAVSYFSNSSPWVKFCDFLARGSHDAMASTVQAETWDRSPFRAPTHQWHRLDDDKRYTLMFLTCMQLMSSAIKTFEYCQHFSSTSPRAKDHSTALVSVQRHDQSDKKIKNEQIMQHHDVHFNITDGVMMGCSLNKDLTLTCCVDSASRLPFTCTNIDLLSAFDPQYDCCTTTIDGTVICGKNYCGYVDAVNGICTDSDRLADVAVSFSQKHHTLIAELENTGSKYLTQLQHFVHHIESNLNIDIENKTNAVTRAEDDTQIVAYKNNTLAVSRKFVAVANHLPLDILLARNLARQLMENPQTTHPSVFAQFVAVINKLHEHVQFLYSAAQYIIQHTPNFDALDIDLELCGSYTMQFLHTLLSCSSSIFNYYTHYRSIISDGLDKLILTCAQQTLASTQTVFNSYRHYRLVLADYVDTIIVECAKHMLSSAQIVFNGYTHYRSIISDGADKLAYNTLQQIKDVISFLLRQNFIEREADLYEEDDINVGAMFKNIFSKIEAFKYGIRYFMQQNIQSDSAAKNITNFDENQQENNITGEHIIAQQPNNQVAIKQYLANEKVANEKAEEKTEKNTADENTKPINQTSTTPEACYQLVKAQPAVKQIPQEDMFEKIFTMFQRAMKRLLVDEKMHQRTLGNNIAADIFGSLASYDSNTQSAEHWAIALMNFEKMHILLDAGFSSEDEIYQALDRVTPKSLCAQRLPAVNFMTSGAVSEQVMLGELTDYKMRAVIMLKLNLILKALAKHLHKEQSKKDMSAKN